MPTTLGEPHPITYRGKYPHLLPEDYPVWESFLRDHAHDYSRFYYDARLGGPTYPTEPAADKWTLLWSLLKPFRPDVIADTPDGWTIIEITAHAGVRALGQIVLYDALWRRAPIDTRPAITALLCYNIDPDIAAVVMDLGHRLMIQQP